MRYEIKCPVCGAEYGVYTDFSPCFCQKCGSDLIDVTVPRTKARITAEALMAELDELKPKLDAAYEAWFAERIRYEDVWQRLHTYKKRNVITEEEYDRYRVALNRSKDINKHMSEYRRKRREAKMS